MPSELDLAWAAGFMEGEGSIRISKPAERNWGSLTVSATNTERAPIEKLQAMQAGCLKRASVASAHHRQGWVWTIAARRAALFLRSIRPYVVGERTRAKIDFALSFQEQKRISARSEEYRQAQWEWYWWMAHLNQHGPDAPFYVDQEAPDAPITKGNG